MLPRLRVVSVFVFATSVFACAPNSSESSESSDALTGAELAPEGKISAYLEFEQIYSRERPDGCKSAPEDRCYVVRLRQSSFAHEMSRPISNFVSREGYALAITSGAVPIPSLAFTSKGRPSKRTIAGREVYEGDLVEVAYSNGSFKRTAPGAYELSKIDALKVSQDNSRIQCVATSAVDIYYAYVQPEVNKADPRTSSRTFFRLDRCEKDDIGACSDVIVGTSFDTAKLVAAGAGGSARSDSEGGVGHHLEFELRKLYESEGRGMPPSGRRESSVTLKLDAPLPAEPRFDSLTVRNDVLEDEAASRATNASVSWTYKVTGQDLTLEGSLPMHCSRWE